jgi:hypothetical protein
MEIYIRDRRQEEEEEEEELACDWIGLEVFLLLGY